MRQAITVRMKGKLGHAFERYRRWRQETSGIKRFSKQQAAEELIRYALNSWLQRTFKGRPIQDD